MPVSPLLDPLAIQTAEHLGLAVRGIVEGYMAGAHRSPFRGFAIEFAQHREYSPGDDTRHLDWKVLARTGRYYLKQYEQETNFVAHLVLDASESMKFASAKISKWHYARTAAACLAYLTLLQRDATAVSVFADGPRDQHPRTDNLGKIHAICSILTRLEPVGKTRLAPALHDLARAHKRRGLVFIFSDCFDDEDALLDAIRHLRFIGHDVTLLHVLDPAELDFPFTGTVQFIGIEDAARLTTRPAEVRKTYLAEFGAFVEKIRRGCQQSGADYLQLRTDQPWPEVLSAWLAQRHPQRK